MTSRSSAVTPKRELAYLVLVSSKDDADKQETPKIVVEQVEDKMEIDEVPPTQQDDDAASEGTLVNETPDGIAPEDVSMVDPALREVGKENLPPTEEAAAELSKATAEEITMTVDDDKTTVVGDSPLTPPPDSQPQPDNQPPPIPERPRRDTIMDVDMFGRQQDVTECIGNVMFQLEAAIKAASVDDNGEQIDLIKDYLYGKTKQTLIFPDSSTRTKDEFFSHLIVDVADGDRDLYAALDANFDVEQVDLEGQHAKRYLSVSQLPPVLQFQVQRVQFSRERNAAYKSNARLKFPETIYMDRYFEDEGNAALLSRREESWKWKEQLKQLLLRKAELVNIQVPVKEDRAPVRSPFLFT
jgi:ubiquitin carboxyl-terminal hydrolase 25/28